MHALFIVKSNSIVIFCDILDAVHGDCAPFPFDVLHSIVSSNFSHSQDYKYTFKHG